MKVAIVEDSGVDTKTLCDQLNNYSENNGVTFDIDKYSDGLSFLKEFKSQYEIIFLDMEMPLLNGMDTAKEIRKFDNNVLLIFITRIESFAVQGYTVDAVSYLLKPVSYFNMSNALQKAINMISRRNTVDININTKKGVIVVSSDDIYFCEISDHDLVYHTSRGEFLSHETMAEVENKLKGKNFCRCSNCYLVNLKYVRSAENNIVNLPNNKLHISRGKKKEFMESLMLYLGGKQ